MLRFRILTVAAVIAAATSLSSNAQNAKRIEALPDAYWDASVWISAADAPVVTEKNPFRAADGASWFVCTLPVEAKVTSAKWMTCALGVYDLYVNGRRIGEEFLKPGFTDPRKTRRSFTYDISELYNSKPGDKNVLAAEVTPGWWADRIVTQWGSQDSGFMGKKCAFRGVLELTFADGTKKIIGTWPTKWRAGIAGPVKHAGIYDGEEYDAREMPGYASILGAAEENLEFGGKILPSEGAEIYLRRDLALKPVKAYVWEEVTGAVQAEKKEDIHYGTVVVKRDYSKGGNITLNPGETLVIDFGQNCSAVPAFTFKAAQGATLKCLPGEILNDGDGAESRGMDGPGGSVHRRNLRAQDKGMMIDYTFAGTGGFERYMPRKSFFGYRYISVTASDKVEIKEVRSIPVSSITKELETGTLKTGNDLINQLISNTIWGQRSNYLSVPTDCPQRDERLGWMADTQVFTETGTFFANTDPFFHKWLKDVRDSQSESGGYPGVAPKSAGGGEFMRVGWADAGIIVPWTVWKQFGDKKIIDESWESMERFMAHVDETCYDHTALRSENGNYQWADWLSWEDLDCCNGSAFDGGHPKPEAIVYWSYLSANYWMMDAGMMRDMAVATGRDASKYIAMVARAKAYLKETFLNEDGTFKTENLNQMQTPAVFALKNGLVEGAAKEAVLARLKDNIAAHGGCLSTGFLGTSILMSTLTENGMADVAWNLLLQRNFPSWLYSVDNGATTIWERWNSYTIENGMGPKGMNSFNHYAYGSVCAWIWETVAGIAADPAEPGFKHIIMKPVPDKRLGSIEAEYNSAAGLIKSSWHYEGDTWVWHFTIPEGSTATVTLPAGSAPKDYGPGSHSVRI